jgi:four helix bundle protein
MIRASRSATANIAEAFGRFHYQESIQFCRQGRGSLYELIDHLHVAAEEGYISEASFQKLREEILRSVKVLNGFIRYLSQNREGVSADKKASTARQATNTRINE